CAWVLRGVYRMVYGKRIEKLVPHEPRSPVEKDDWRTTSSHFDVRHDFSLPDGDLAIGNCRHALFSPLGACVAYCTVCFWRSVVGQQRFSHSSSHRWRSAGATSRKKRSVFFRVNSWGIEPIWSSTMRLPIRNASQASWS